MIYDFSYFQNDLHLPNIFDNDDVVNNNDELLKVIRETDVEFLNDCFGIAFTKEILNAIDSDGIVNPNKPIIKKLVDGDDDYDWLGLRFTLNTNKYCMLANFAYCQYLSQTNTRLTQVGTVKDSIQNGQDRSNVVKYVIAWNKMVGMRQDEKLYKSFGITLEKYIIENPDLNCEYFVKYRTINSFGL